VARAWLNVWGLLLLIVIAFGVVVPLVLSWRGDRRRQGWNVVTVTSLILLGGFLLRVVIIFSSEAI
jgi:formate-dependent nitrite reductase membrane component NrfD